MIKVNCVVESIGKKGGYPQMEVNSVKDSYGVVELVLSDKKIIVDANDLIKAVKTATIPAVAGIRAPMRIMTKSNQ